MGQAETLSAEPRITFAKKRGEAPLFLRSAKNPLPASYLFVKQIKARLEQFILRKEQKISENLAGVCGKQLKISLYTPPLSMVKYPCPQGGRPSDEAGRRDQ